MLREEGGGLSKGGRGAALLVVGLAAVAPGLLNRVRPVCSRRGAVVYYMVFALLLGLNRARLAGLVALPEGGWSVAIPAVVLIQAAVVLVLAVRARGAARPPEYYLVASLAALSLASLLQYYPMPCARHILWSLAPAFGLFVWAVWRGSAGRPLAVVVALAVAFGPPAYVKYRWARYTLGQPLVTVAQPAVLAGLRVPAAQARALGQVDAAIQQVLRRAPQTPSVLLGYDALWVCLTPNRENPGPYYVTWTLLMSADEARVRWGWILQNRPVVILEKPQPEALRKFCLNERYSVILTLAVPDLAVMVPVELADTPTTPAGGGPP